jgi:hypothetical protein
MSRLSRWIIWPPVRSCMLFDGLSRTLGRFWAYRRGGKCPFGYPRPAALCSSGRDQTATSFSLARSGSSCSQIFRMAAPSPRELPPPSALPALLATHRPLLHPPCPWTPLLSAGRLRDNLDPYAAAGISKSRGIVWSSRRLLHRLSSTPNGKTSGTHSPCRLVDVSSPRPASPLLHFRCWFEAHSREPSPIYRRTWLDGNSGSLDCALRPPITGFDGASGS